MGAAMRYQPQIGERVDLSHPLARGIQAAFLPGSNGFLRDALTGIAFDTSSGAFTTAANVAGRGVKNSARNSQSAPDVKNAYANPSYTYLMIVDVVDTGATYAGLYCRSTSGASTASLQMSPASGGKLDVYHDGSGPAYTTTAGTGFTSYLLAGLCVIAVCYNDGDRSIRFYKNGALIESGTATVSPISGAGRLVLFGERGESATYGMQGTCDGMFIWNRALSDADAKKITSSLVSPFQIFRAPDEDELITVAGAAALAGAAAGVATGAGSLTTAIKLAGAASASASSTAVLTTSIALTGAASAAGTASGALGTAIKLVGQAAASASLSGALITGIPLAGSAAASSAASASLTTQGAGMAGQAVVASTATGALTTGIVLAGTGAAVATSTASVTTTPAGMAGSAAANASASASLTTAIKLAGAGAAQASAGASLGTGAALSGAAAAGASATAVLSTAIALASIAQAQASASGSLSAAAGFAGAAAASTAATAVLSTKIMMAGIAAAQASASATLGNVDLFALGNSSVYQVEGRGAVWAPEARGTVWQA